MKSHLLERIPTHCPSARECQCYRSRPASRNTLEKSECSQRLSRRLVAESEQSVGGSPDWIELLSLNLQPALLSALQESFYVSPSSHCHWPMATLHRSQFPVSLQVVGAIGTSMHLSLHCVQPGPEDQEPRPLFWTSCFLMVSQSFLFESHSESLQNLSVSIQK